MFSGLLIPTGESFKRMEYLNIAVNQVFYFFFDTVYWNVDVKHHRIKLLLTPNGSRRVPLLRLQRRAQSPDINSFHYLWDDVERFFNTWFNTHTTTIFKNPCPDKFFESKKMKYTLKEIQFISCVVKTHCNCLHIRLKMRFCRLTMKDFPQMYYS